MAKNILIFADGTGQVGGMRPDQQLSNVYKLYRATRVGPDSPINPTEQVSFYDPGIGTASASGVVRLELWQSVRSFVSQVFGLGFSRNLIECYEAILKHYEPGDRIYLIGFSRGGYTVRALANVLNQCGVPESDGKGGPFPRAGLTLRSIATEAVRTVYEHGSGWPRKTFDAQRERKALLFRKKYDVPGDENRADVHPEFVGVFDAVAALGVPMVQRIAAIVAALVVLGGLGWAIERWTTWQPQWSGWEWALMTAGVGGLLAFLTFIALTIRWAPSGVGGWPFHLAFWRVKDYDRYLDYRIPIVRHALAIDETRRHFGRVEWGGGKNNNRFTDGRPHLWQLWFAGNHSDIGGSYAEDESRLSDIALKWMLDEATCGRNPIYVDKTKLRLYPDSFGPQHSEPFSAQNGSRLRRLAPWPEKDREISDTADLHPSVIARLRAESVPSCGRKVIYRPLSLRGHKYLGEFFGVQPGAKKINTQ